MTNKGNTKLFDRMTSGGISACMKAKAIAPEKRNFLNKEWEEAFHEFCRETAWQDKDPKSFETYVNYWGKGIDESGYTRIEQDKRANTKWYQMTKTRMMTPHDTTTKANTSIHKSPFAQKDAKSTINQTDFNDMMGNWKKVNHYEELRKELLGDLYYVD